MAELWPDSPFHLLVHELTHFKAGLGLAEIGDIGFKLGLKLCEPMQLNERKVGSQKEAVELIAKRAWRWLFPNNSGKLAKSAAGGAAIESADMAWVRARYHCDAEQNAAELGRALHFAGGVLKGVAAALGVDCSVEPTFAESGRICRFVFVAAGSEN